MKNRYLFVLVIIAIFFINLFGLSVAGPEYDEFLTANASLNCPANTFIENVYWIKGQCIPLMLSSYIGGILMVPYKLLFLIFPASVSLFRFFNISIFLVSLFLIYVSFKNLFNKKIALISLILLGFDFQLLFNIRFEKPATFPFFVKAFSIFILSKYSSSKKNIYLFLLGALIGLSVWMKMDATFFYAAIIISYLLSNVANLKKISLFLSNKKNKILIFLSGLLLGIAPILLYLKNNLVRFIFVGKEVGKSNFFEVLPNKIELLLYQFSSFDSLWYIFRERVGQNLIILLITSALWMYLLIIFKQSIKSKLSKFLLFSIIIFSMIYLIFGGMVFSHHRYLIYPLPHLLIALYLAKQNIKKIFLFFLIWIIIFSYSYFLLISLSHGNGGQAGASKNIYNLYPNIENIKEEILVGDWGILNQLLIISNGKLKLHEIAFETNVIDKDQLSLDTKKYNS